MSARVTRKRARMEAEQAEEHVGSTSATESVDASTPDFERDEELWYEDGTIILVARGIGFKVYKGPLVDHSPVFKDMLSLPQPATTAAAPNCPVIPLPDSPADLRHVLRLLMPSKRIRLTGVQNASFVAVCACIRIAHKYQIDHLVEESLKYLRKFYPDTFDLFLKSRAKPLNPQYAVTVVNLARLTGATNLLPMALAECCRLGPALVLGIAQADGTREHLSPTDLALCFHAKDKLVEARVKAFAAMFNTLEDVRANVCDHQDQGAPDDEDFETVQTELLDGTVPGLCSPNVWDSLAARVLARIPEICKPCKKAVKSAELEQQKAIFERLPDLVGVVVEGWGKDPSGKK
ncbi:hypothetical protein OH76DRAFT_1404136 [Lentinus brumalis]|uniref:BTB domain-containing protein n=1 Tax=Lentinus brumalis TaxID=2498619 RepID=A0A371D8T4_9APHY|nr:hypothetical protein OH76DRAFT_1404136 [Polyporus brumalis]